MVKRHSINVEEDKENSLGNHANYVDRSVQNFGMGLGSSERDDSVNGLNALNAAEAELLR